MPLALNVLLWIMAGVFGLFMLAWIAFAFLIKRFSKMSQRPQCELSSMSFVPTETRALFTQAQEKLSSLGFADRGILRMLDEPANICNWVICFTNSSTGEHAMVAVVASTIPEAEGIKGTFTELTTKFEGGITFDTSNNSTLLPFPSTKNHYKVTFPELEDLDLLYKAHKQHVSSVGIKSSLQPISYDSPDVFVLHELKESYEKQTKEGYWSFDEAEGVYKPTWNGAFTMAFMLIWPVSAVRRSLIKSRADSLLLKLTQG